VRTFGDEEPSSRPTSPVPRRSPQGTPEALPYPILRRLSSPSQSRATPRSAGLQAAPARPPRRAGRPASARREAGPAARREKQYVIAPLSNSDFDCLVNMAKHAGLPWDAILCAELFHHYKPDLEVYRGAMALLHLKPYEVMMVAAHNYDLHAARSHGMRTGFVSRSLEYGPNQKTDLKAEEDWDIIVKDFGALASALGC
jgi:hypothetical protein